MNLHKGFFLLVLMQYCSTEAAMIDRYGIGLGPGFSNMYEQFGIFNSSNAQGKSLLGFNALFIAEKNLHPFFSVRTDLGYMQKGFIEDHELFFGDGSSGKIRNQKFIMHQVVADLALVFSPWKTSTAYSPYLIIGGRSEYTASYKDIFIYEQASGMKYPLYKNVMSKSNKFKVVPMIGAGIRIDQKWLIELDYNPGFMDYPKFNLTDFALNMRLGYMWNPE